jgi:hypothetical protein
MKVLADGHDLLPATAAIRDWRPVLATRVRDRGRLVSAQMRWKAPPRCAPMAVEAVAAPPTRERSII